MVAPDWLADAVFYQIFPDRFANAEPGLNPPDVLPWDSEPLRDGFLGGDLAGITARLDHIVSVGANALYLTPIFEAHTNHRYDASDYFRVDHRLGDLAAFQRLVEQAHARGIRIVLDAVLNHCGDTHPAFQDVVANEADSEYVNWFSVEGFPVTAYPQPNYRTCSGCHYLPKWNVHNPAVRQHHFDVARYWIDQGIDGWRLDVPYFIHRRFWRDFREVVKAQGEDLYIVAEEWREPEEWLQGDTADGTMNYTLRDLVLGFTADRTLSADAFAAGMNALTARIPTGYHHGMLNLLGSHDTERVLTRHAGDTDRAALAYELLFASAGAPMIYYGDEVGMTGANDPGCRAGMIWEQERWHDGLLAAIRQMAARRAAHEPLRRGAQEVAGLDEDTVLVMRTSGSQRIATIVHRGPGVMRSVADIPALRDRRWRRLDDGASVDELRIAPRAAVVLVSATEGMS